MAAALEEWPFGIISSFRRVLLEWQKSLILLTDTGWLINFYY